MTQTSELRSLEAWACPPGRADCLGTGCLLCIPWAWWMGHGPGPSGVSTAYCRVCPACCFRPVQSLQRGSGTEATMRAGPQRLHGAHSQPGPLAAPIWQRRPRVAGAMDLGGLLPALDQLLLGRVRSSDCFPFPGSLLPYAPRPPALCPSRRQLPSALPLLMANSALKQRPLSFLPCLSTEHLAPST